MDLSRFEKYYISDKVPELPLMTWTFHDKPSQNGKTIRMTSVCVVHPVAQPGRFVDGLVFTGVSGCSELDTFEKKDGFNRAYGRATQKLVRWVLNKEQQYKDGVVQCVDLVIYNLPSVEMHDLTKWISQHAYEEKLKFIKNVYRHRVQLGKLKVDLVMNPHLAVLVA